MWRGGTVASVAKYGELAWGSVYLQGPFRLPQRGRATAASDVLADDSPGVRHAHETTQPALCIDFRDTKTAYRSKSFGQLLRAYFVFEICSIKKLVESQKQLLVLTRKVLGRYTFRKLMRLTIYGQFSGGETDEEILSQARLYRQYGVQSMFAYTAGEMHGDASGSVKFDVADFYKKNYDNVLKSMDIAASSKVPGDPLTKVTGKFTFLGSTDAMTHLTTVIKNNVDALTKVSEETFRSRVESAKPVMLNLQKAMDSPLAMPVPQLEFERKTRDTWLTSTLFHMALSKIDASMTQQDFNDILELWNNLTQLSKSAADRGVAMVWDAEQSYIQLAIEFMILDLQRIFNKRDPIVHGTYQCYLKRALTIMKRDLDMAKLEGFHLAFKTVRGAYLDEERRLAKEHGYEDPVNPNYDATTAMYHAVVDEVLGRISKSGSDNTITITVATHNENTCKYAAERMNALGIPPKHESIAFAQLIGMRDHIAFLMASTNYPTQKLIHYGDVEENVAHLSRRMMENRSGFPAADLERDLFAREISRRVRHLKLGRDKMA